jgi:MFS family permease
LTVSAHFGLAVGSFIGGKIGANYGIRKVLLYSNAINIFVFSPIKLIEHSVIIMIGRFLFGVACGIQNFCLSKALNDTVPSSVS